MKIVIICYIRVGHEHTFIMIIVVVLVDVSDAVVLQAQGPSSRAQAATYPRHLHCIIILLRLDILHSSVNDNRAHFLRTFDSRRFLIPPSGLCIYVRPCRYIRAAIPHQHNYPIQVNSVNARDLR